MYEHLRTEAMTQAEAQGHRMTRWGFPRLHQECAHAVCMDCCRAAMVVVTDVWTTTTKPSGRALTEPCDKKPIEPEKIP